MQVLKFIAPVAFALSLTPATFTNAFAAADPTGIWMNDTGRGAIEIKSCGNALCGTVVWVKSSSDTQGCGMKIIGGVKAIGGGRWDNGWIYSPEKARKYDVELTPLSSGNLKVVGYAGLKFLSQTMIWKPAPADLPLCQNKATAPANTDASAPAGVAPKANPSASAPKPAQEANTNDKPVPAPNAAPAATASGTAAPPAEPDQADQPGDTAANADNDAPADSSGGLADNLSKMKIGDVSLDKVLTKTKNGKCKLDLPWVKVTIDCEH